MSDLAIRVEKLSKQYKIRVGRYRHDTLRDVLTSAIYAPFQAMASTLNGRRSSVAGQPSCLSAQRSGPSDTIWALKDVSLEVKKGEVVGIIGPNGAGKSTLLKILSRVTEPTDGSADIWGRVGSLLEVGTGFHPELSGRENSYLSGAILGMKRAEIDRKFDEIVDFCGLEKFIDTPVKRYSSGMYVRLAFAVAAHLETEVLLVDEVLAVGDAAFQKKCLGKMGKVSAEGRTVVIVSHNLPTIASLARACIRLENGQVVKSGSPHEVIKGYLDDTLHYKKGRGETDLLNHPRSRLLPREVEFHTVRLLKECGAISPLFIEREPMTIEVTLQVKIQASFIDLVCKILTTEGVVVFSIASNKFAVDLRPGLYTVAAPIKPNYLRPGKYRIHLSVQTRSAVKQDEIDDGIFFEIEHDTKGYDNPFWGGDRGVVRFDYQWGSLLLH